MEIVDLHGPAISYLTNEQLQELVTIGVTYLRVRPAKDGFVDFEPLPINIVEMVANHREQSDG